MQIILFDNIHTKQLSPLTTTRAVAMLRMGLFTGKERWELISDKEVFIHTRPYLQPLYNEFAAMDAVWIDAAVLPDNNFISLVEKLSINEALLDEKQNCIAFRTDHYFNNFKEEYAEYIQTSKVAKGVKTLEYPWQIMQWNDFAIRADIELIKKKNIKYQPIPATTTAICSENIFIEEGADVQYAFLNASTGSDYIKKNATVQEGAFIRGPFVLGENSLVRMGAKIYGATSIGDNCVVGGEIKNIVMTGNSNKAHDGYLGDSVIGEWCNFGAGSSNSNVKNTGGIVNVWNDDADGYIPVAQKCGLIMGDYSKTAINSSINTGSVIGICCNVFGAGLLPKHIKNFSWGAGGNTKYDFEKALKEIENWKQMKQNRLSSCDVDVLRHIFADL